MSMTNTEFREARQRLNLSQDALARLLGLPSGRTVRRWEADPSSDGARKPPETACRVLRWMLEPGRPADWPTPPQQERTRN